MKLDMQVGLVAGHIAKGTQLSLPKKGQSPQFSAYVHCGQTAAWIKMPFGMVVGLDPGDIVLDWEPVAPFPKNGAGLDSGDIVLDGNPAPPPQRGCEAPSFRAMSIVAKQLDG